MWRKFLFRVRSSHAVASMAAKNKQRRRRKGDTKVTFNPEETDMEAGNSEGVEDGETAAGGGGQTKPRAGGEEFNLDEVLKLGGTQVGPWRRASAWWFSRVTWIMSSSVGIMTKPEAVRCLSLLSTYL